MVIHVEGMGWLGSVVAWHLHRAGIDFTWNDTGSAHVAWRASTGIVYPAGDLRSTSDHAAWLAWLGDPWWPPGLAAAETCSYWFNHRNPPHGGRYQLAADIGWARMASVPAVQVNVPAIVSATRAAFRDAQRTRPVPAEVTIRAHGFGPRLDAYVWGWAVPVELAYPPELADACSHGRPTFYGREGRYKMAYAYALPGTPRWLAGSSLITQRTAKELDARKHFATWCDTFARVLPKVELLSVGEPMQGWRPKPAPDDAGYVTSERTARGRLISVPPLWHSGVRWAPSVVAQVMEAL